MTILPERAPADILSGVARVTLGDRTYVLRALPRRQAAEWNASIDGRLHSLLGGLDEAGNDVSTILPLLVAEPDALFDSLLTYDRDGILPRDLIDETATNNEILVAVLEVWRAANPFVDAALGALRLAPMLSTLFAPSSTPPAPGAGPPDTSTATKPTNGSSPTSTPPRNGTRPSSATGSKRRGSGRSSPTTPRRTAVGSGAPGGLSQP
jgi:hypothetical protein